MSNIALLLTAAYGGGYSALRSAAAPYAKPRQQNASATQHPDNAITDVPGVEVGYATLIQGTGAWKQGAGPIRTGGTVVLPKGKPMRRTMQATSSSTLIGR